MKIKEHTLAIIRQDGKILLGLKHPGRFGGNFWNFPGGKLDDETPEQAMVREVQEECGLHVLQYKSRGMLNFEFVEDPMIRRVHVFEVTAFEGTLKSVSSDDEFVQLRWFLPAEIPYAQMFKADKYWVPLVVEGKPFPDRFLYDNAREFNLLSPKSS